MLGQKFTVCVFTTLLTVSAWAGERSSGGIPVPEVALLRLACEAKIESPPATYRLEVRYQNPNPNFDEAKDFYLDLTVETDGRYEILLNREVARKIPSDPDFLEGYEQLSNDASFDLTLIIDSEVEQSDSDPPSFLARLVLNLRTPNEHFGEEGTSTYKAVCSYGVR